MNASQTIGALAAALAKAQGSFPAIPKNKTARVPMKAGGTYSYSYADLADILDATRPALSANGLALVQPVAITGMQVTVRTRLLHASGEWLEEELTMKAADDRPQSLGACATYARRYSASGMLNVAPDEDVDGEVQEVAPRQRQAKAAPPARPAEPPAPVAGPLEPGVDPASMEKPALPPVTKVIAARVQRLIDSGACTSKTFLHFATQTLGRNITGLASLSINDMERIEAKAKEVPDEELGRRQVPVQDYQDGSGVAA